MKMDFRSGPIGLMMVIGLMAALVACVAPQEQADWDAGEPEAVRTVEGISEYRLANGMQVLLVPDESRSSVTVNTTYFVGSRHESYGETGMAHLLEHMLFYGTDKHPDIRSEISERGGRANGTTWFDRTNYFQTFPASEENLKWALSMEADRMVNATFTEEDLASEMTVVRNEFEIGENDPFRILMQRTLGVAHEWHGYGRSTIGARSDIENVPFERLRDFYRRYYQPDNAVVIISGNFDPDTILAQVNAEFGQIPAPDRDEELRIWDTYTREPTQDGERKVEVRRSGDSQFLMAAYHVPAGAHPDYPDVDLLAHVIGSQPSGRLYKALVETELATQVGAFSFSLREPGVLLAFAELEPDQDIDKVEEKFRQTLDDLRQEKITEDEVNRARGSRLRQLETGTLNDSQRIGIALSEWAASGDWRLIFLHRDRLEESGQDTVQHAAEAYLRRDNRSIGRFIPDSITDRSTIPEVEDLEKVLAEHEFSEEGRIGGERFEATPENIHNRLITHELANGMQVAMLPKQTRGGRVAGHLVMRFGDEDNLRGQQIVGGFTAAMLMRGSENHSRQELSDYLDELQSEMNVRGSVNRALVQMDTREEVLGDLLALSAEVLKTPQFSEGEFDELKRGQIRQIRDSLTQPQQQAFGNIGNVFTNREPDHPGYSMTPRERLDGMEALELSDIKDFHASFYGMSDASLILVGQFDPEQVLTQLEALFGDWESPYPYQRIGGESYDPQGSLRIIRTPDRSNAAMMAAHRVHLSEAHDDYPAMAMANHLIGGGFLNSRLAERIRNQEGLSYQVAANLNVDPLDDSGLFLGIAMFAPENRDKLLEVFKEELNKVLDEGFSQEELEAGQRGWLQAREVARGSDSELAGLISGNLAVGRDMLREQALDEAIEKLDVETLNQAVRRHLRPDDLSIIIAGDFDDGEEVDRD